jgi:putative ABC transport system permease protein
MPLPKASIDVLEAVRIALASLWANKLRSALTLLGIVIGVAAVIAVVTFVNGINGYVAEKIFNLGADVFIVNKQSNVILSADQYLEQTRRKDLTLDDYYAVRDGCLHCLEVGASAYWTNAHVKYGQQSSSDTWARGWTPSMAKIYDLELVSGRTISDADMRAASDVAVIGHDILDNLMPGADPIGKEIRVDGRTFRVIGVGRKEVKTLGQSRDNWVMIPLTTWMHQYGSVIGAMTTTGAPAVLKIWAKATDAGSGLESAMDEARVIMRARRHDAPGKPDDFEIDNNQTFLSLWAGISSNFFLVTVAMASISLIVGGIVIMNIMLVSVTERTREIGIRKALGARRSDVLLQFLIESGTMALVGGMIGVAAGIFVAKTVTLLIGMPSAIKMWAVLAGLFVSGFVGVFFGVYPARRAALLDPIVALRSEL